ncbi:hypothetical protein VTN77DRAFT_777 [Rasamsonia byssochlamydoides]|uniref:uncharacterized protein n=1 Tax=Rasamsonia byssochlamydoides TaxID=89139 RepID=UPI0037442808
MAPTTFKGLVVVASGTFPGYKQTDLKKIVENNGGSFNSKVSDECTHLVSTQKEVDNNGTKNKQAAKLDSCHIVSLDWLLDSEKAKKRLPEKKYLFSSTKDASGKNDFADTKNENGSSKKRSLADSLDKDEKLPNKKQRDGQKAKFKDLKVDVDEVCQHQYGGSLEVYIDSSGLIWDAALNQTNAANNNNKFYRIQLLKKKSADEYNTWTRWGRVGEFGQSAMLGNGTLDVAKRHFEKKFRDKTGLSWADRLAPPKTGKYAFVERNYEESDTEDEKATKKKVKKETQEEERKPVESTLPEPVQQLIAFIFNQQHFYNTMAQMSYDANKLPLGKLSKRTLQTGFQILKDLSELINNQSLATSKYGKSYAAATEELSNRYFTIIPHVFGRNRPPVINTPDLIKKEVDLLENLTDMEIANSIVKESKDDEMVHILDRQFQGLGMREMTPLDHKSTEFQELENYLMKSHGSTHYMRFQVQDIFRIEREGENERFLKSKYANIKNSNRRLLWHGSRSTNFGGILSQGLRIAPPEAPVSGYMFGKGVYFADISSKSAGYCWASNSGKIGLLLLCDVELGDPMLELEHGNYNAGDDAKAKGCLATLGLGATAPQRWKDASCVHPNLKGVLMPDTSVPPGPSGKGASLLYNEYIVYDVAQIRQRYLLKVHMY